MKNFLSRKRSRLLAVILLFLLGLLFFPLKNRAFPSENIRFEQFTEKLFLDEIRSNTLNLHYTLAYPEKYGITDYDISLGSINPESEKENLDSLKTFQKKLLSFSPEKLSAKNRLLYDTLRLESANRLSSKDSFLLQEPLGPSLGIQAQLPVLLAEYTFRTPKDVRDYFSLLSAIPAFFSEITKFEQQKAKAGSFMSDASVDRIISQCASFTENKKENFLNETFLQRIDSLLTQKQITKTQYDSYLNMHQKLLADCVFPAYKALCNDLSVLKGSGKNTNGLAHVKGGKSYYQNLIKTTVGDYRPVKEIEAQLKKQLSTDYEKLQVLLKKDPEIAKKAAGLSYESTFTPQQILDYLQHSMTDDFPSLFVTDYEVKHVHKSMEEFSSPAFYLTPPIDTLSPNIIYINQRTPVSQAELFTTLAHEGFPGHLYQTLYFGKQQTNPLQNLLACGGYIEGWATYTEFLSYSYAASCLHIEPDVMQFLSLNRSVSLCLYSLLDIGIHYRGWTPKVVRDTLAVFGIQEEAVCQDIFQYIVENPANYLKYYLGYLNFVDLKNTVSDIEGNSFDIKKFHQNLLEIGPAPFPVLKKYLLLRYSSTQKDDIQLSGCIPSSFYAFISFISIFYTNQKIL